MRAVVVLSATAFGTALDMDNIEHYVVLGVVVAQSLALILPDKIEKKRNDSTKQDNTD